MRAWAAAAFVEPHALVSVFGVAVINGMVILVCWVATTLRHEHKGSRIAFVKAKAAPRVGVAETPQASPFLGAHGKQFHQPGPSSVSPHSLLVRALTGRTLVVRWSSLDNVLHCVSERTGVPLFRQWIVPLPFLWSCMAGSVAVLHRCQEIGRAVVATSVGAELLVIRHSRTLVLAFLGVRAITRQGRRSPSLLR